MAGFQPSTNGRIWVSTEVVGEEARRDVERAVGAGAARIRSTSVNALIFIVMKIKAGELLDFDLHRECRDCDTDSMRRVLPCLPPDVW